MQLLSDASAARKGEGQKPKPRPKLPAEMVAKADALGAKLIPLTKDKFAMVDIEYYDALSEANWFYSGNYAHTRIPNAGNRKLIAMHRIIANTPEGLVTDHINGDKLDNRKINLRICEHSQNHCNRPKQKNNRSGFKGVSYHKSTGFYYSYVCFKGKRQCLGNFKTAELAHEAYKRKALELHGQFAQF